MKEREWRDQYEPLLAKYPVFVTEWGWDESSVFPLRGDLQGFGMPFGTFVERKDLRRFMEHLQKCKRQDCQVSTDLTLRLPDGRTLT